MNLFERISSSPLIRQWDGPITRETKLNDSPLGLSKLPEKLQPDSSTTAVCGYCSTGCSVQIHHKNGEAINASGDGSYPVNTGMCCPKGWEILAPLKSSDRATQPLLRNASGIMEAVSWDTALQTFCQRFKQVQAQHGAASVAFISTGQIPMEEMAFLGSLAKFGMGVMHGDGNTRQCMASAAVAYKQAFGYDAPPFTYADFEESDTLVFIGANPCIAHPILWGRVLKNTHRPNIIVLDPRRTETAVAATHHYALKPKSDLVLFYGLVQQFIQRGWIQEKYIANFTEGYDEYKQNVASFSLELVAQETGLSIAALEELLSLLHAGKRVSFWWTMGVNQSHQGVRTIQAIIALALLTGNIGRPGTGANSITGQVNAMGSRIFSNTTGLLGGRDFTNLDHRQHVANCLNIPVESIPQQNSLPYNKILDAIDEGKIKGLWVIATNPGHSWINRHHYDSLIKKLDFLVVQDMYYSTETVSQAHLLLPAAGWGEKDGVVINSERRLGLFKKIHKAPGQALSDFSIFRLIADSWGCGEMFKDWTSPEQVFQILKKLSKGMPCDFSGIKDYEHIDREGGIQWPYTEGQVLKKQRRLFEDGLFYTPSKKAKFIFETPRPLPEAPDKSYPLILNTGRGSSAQWHTQTRTGKSEVLRKLYPHNIYVEIHPETARHYGIKSGDKIRVFSRRGELQADAKLVSSVAPDQIFIPMHYEATNLLTFPSFDPYSFQPSYKTCAVQIGKV